MPFYFFGSNVVFSSFHHTWLVGVSIMGQYSQVFLPQSCLFYGSSMCIRGVQAETQPQPLSTEPGLLSRWRGLFFILPQFQELTLG